MDEVTPLSSPEEEKCTIRDLTASAEAQIKEGDTFYLITQRWWQGWLEYVTQTPVEGEENCLVSSSVVKRPTSIDNSDLVYGDASVDSVSEIELHDTLVEGKDYILLPEAVWNQLYAWYGGGPTLARKVIDTGLTHTELAVEVHPLRLQLHLIPKLDRAAVRISKKETIRELHRKACKLFNLERDQVRLWDYDSHQKHALDEMEKTLDHANIQMDHDILVEVFDMNTNGGLIAAHENGVAPYGALALIESSQSGLSTALGVSASKGSSRNGNSVLQSQHMSSVGDAGRTYGSSGISTRSSSYGLTGLLNLGNTCYMNSAIQCLVHTPEFTRYFLEDYYKEINRQNPLGMVGELALAFGDLLRKLWLPGRIPVAPRPFKAKLARFAPQFSGYNQHDSQELLAFLLDGLHEDLNRVKHKPYIKSRDADGRPDEEVADEYWANHTARNDSIIVDVCQGQYKSTLVCPICNKVSVTFDPFMYLSLPLQPTTTRSMTVTVFTCDASALPIACTVSVPKHGRCKDLTQALTEACSLNPNEELLLAEIRGHVIHCFIEDPLLSVSSIKDEDHLAAYKIPKLEKNVKYLQLRHRQEVRGSSNGQSISVWKPCGTPLVTPISFEEDVTRANIQSMVHRMLAPMLRTSNSTASQKLPLRLVDENNECIDLTVGEEKVVRLSSSSSPTILVFIDWSHKLLKSYDTHYLENLPEVTKCGPVTKKARTESLSLYTCLESFLREEPLVPEDMWYCPQCKERRQASKKLDLWRLPEVLVMHLKRFSYSRSIKHKLETLVNFPIHGFDLTKYVANKNNDQPQLYELYALTNHYGGMGSGHYTAHIKLLDENRWYNFDDSQISAMNEEEVKSAAAYVLFYRRVKDISPL